MSIGIFAVESEYFHDELKELYRQARLKMDVPQDIEKLVTDILVEIHNMDLDQKGKKDQVCSIAGQVTAHKFHKHIIQGILDPLEVNAEEYYHLGEDGWKLVASQLWSISHQGVVLFDDSESMVDMPDSLSCKKMFFHHFPGTEVVACCVVLTDGTQMHSSVLYRKGIRKDRVLQDAQRLAVSAIEYKASM